MPTEPGAARVAVIVPCYNDGRYVEEALASVSETEPVEIVVVNDCSTDEDTQAVLARLADSGVTVLHHEENQGLGATRNTALANTSAPYVFPLDSDDVAYPGILGRLADRLDAEPAAMAAYGDYEEFGDLEIARPVPEALDPYRVMYTNEYPQTALFRRSVLTEVGGWDHHTELRHGYEDWDLWMHLAEQGRPVAFLGRGETVYRHRLHGPRLLGEAKKRHHQTYRYLRSRHRLLFAQKAAHRRASSLGTGRKVAYPILYGRRRRFAFEPKVKALLERLGLWNLRR